MDARICTVRSGDGCAEHDGDGAECAIAAHPGARGEDGLRHADGQQHEHVGAKEVDIADGREKGALLSLANVGVKAQRVHAHRVEHAQHSAQRGGKHQQHSQQARIPQAKGDVGTGRAAAEHEA